MKVNIKYPEKRVFYAEVNKAQTLQLYIPKLESFLSEENIPTMQVLWGQEMLTPSTYGALRSVIS